jgi:hypothetical protein
VPPLPTHHHPLLLGDHTGTGEFLFDGSLPAVFRFQATPMSPVPLPERVLVVRVLLDGASRVLSLAYKNAPKAKGKGKGMAKRVGGAALPGPKRRRRLALQLSASFATIALSIVDCFRQASVWWVCGECVVWYGVT